MKARQVLLAATAAVAMLMAAPAPLWAAAPPAPGYVAGMAQEGWEAPPAEYQDDVARRGFHDGIEGARKDAENHRPPNVRNRDEYRHPDVPGAARRTYREAFRRGYDVGVQHLMGRR